MAHPKHFLSIWLFIGALLLIYGILILGAGIYEVWHPPEQLTVLANLHAPIWWGALLLVLELVGLHDCVLATRWALCAEGTRREGSPVRAVPFAPQTCGP